MRWYCAIYSFEDIGTRQGLADFVYIQKLCALGNWREHSQSLWSFQLGEFPKTN